MALRTPDDYRASLRDGRTLFYRGQKVDDIYAHPELRVAVDHAAIDYEVAEDPAHRDLAVWKDPESGEDCSAYYKVPRSTEDLLNRSKLIETCTGLGGTMVTLIKEIGSDGLFALLRTVQGESLEKVQAFYERCRGGDLAVAVAQTDVKGDRSLSPHQQPDPDTYVHVVDRNDEGIVVRGAKCHTSISANADEIIVFPTRAMGADDADFAVAFAVPANAPGLSMYISSYGSGEPDEWAFPLSAKHKMLETLTVFDDVFVPWDRVFVCREPELAGPLALTFVEYHRFTAVSYKLPLVDLLVGAAAEIAQMNGVTKAGHIREKLTQLVIYAETVRALTHMAAIRAKVDERTGIAYPDPMTTNMAKYTFATRYHEALEYVQDIAGGLLVTGPGADDWSSDEVRPVLEKYFVGKAPAAERLRMINLISDLTTRDFGGYHAVLAVHAEGSIEAEKMQILRSYDAGPATTYARRLVDLD
ncbi:MAG: gamma-aminobutyrate dehydratase [Actinobacteria bacterium]|nr:gamma-aminobutyrate dehydratase [Actinomycetota bacterium]